MADPQSAEKDGASAGQGGRATVAMAQPTATGAKAAGERNRTPKSAAPHWADLRRAHYSDSVEPKSLLEFRSTRLSARLTLRALLFDRGHDFLDRFLDSLFHAADS